MYATRQTRQNINLALFDFDGTLCTRDSFTGFIFFALSKRHILRQGLKILPWIQAYYLKLYPAHAMRPKLFAAMFKDTSATELEKLAQDYAELLLDDLDQQLLERLQQHQQLGDRVVLVSASVDVYLKPLCDALAIDLICSATEVQNQRFTGNYLSADCSCAEKKRRVLQQYRLEEFAQVYAYGNSHEDLEMLSLAQQCFMVGVDQQLPPLVNIKKLA